MSEEAKGSPAEKDAPVIGRQDAKKPKASSPKIAREVNKAKPVSTSEMRGGTVREDY
ncbi:hypothetical protein ABIE64_002651 [Thalassospira sp. MBR-102]|uniref:hypothetical protein n=1 Tax=Thalassospira sp. MBR-102 TaxID=3156466 RepID=UPI003395A768